MSGPTRRDLLLQLAYLLEENKQFVAEIESKDNGKTVSAARDVDIALGVKYLRYFAGWADKLQGETISPENTGTMAMTFHVSNYLLVNRRSLFPSFGFKCLHFLLLNFK